MSGIQCDRHGLQEETFVCQHIVETLRDRKPRGFYWVKDSEDRRPNAWCSECEARVKKTGGEWMGDSLTHLNAKLLCGACYDEAAQINGIQSPAA
jgi:hypothetical protein